MAVLRLNVADQTRHTSFDAALTRWWHPTAFASNTRTLHHIAFTDLPADVRDCEATFIVCFRASQMLNFLTGGSPEMTFSARIWRCRCTSRRHVARAFWAMVATVVDVACLALRRERRHCQMAWTNYVRRPGRIRRERQIS